MGKAILGLNINDVVMVELNGINYYAPWESGNNTRVITESDTLAEYSLFGYEGIEKQSLLEKNHLIKIEEFAGRYISQDKTSIKIAPLFGIENTESKYFIIEIDQIKEVYKITHLEQAMHDMDKVNQNRRIMEKAKEGEESTQMSGSKAAKHLKKVY
jgi:hypothetical protein